MTTSNPFEHYNILGIEVVALDEGQTTALISGKLEANEFTHIAFLNANNANIAQKNTELRKKLQKSLVLPDGFGVDLAARLLYGKPFPHNLNGTDFVPELFKRLEKKVTIGMIGSKADVVERARDAFAAATPQHEFKVYADGYFPIEKTPEILAQLKADRPDFLIVAMGTPFQELWVEKNISDEHCTIVLSVGALFDFIGKEVPRAPLWMRNMRMEWLYRFNLEPERLWRRYLIGNPLFLYRALRQRLNSSKPTQNPPKQSPRNA